MCHTLTRDPWSLESKVPTDVATSHDRKTHSRHRADNNCLARGNGSEIQIRLFYEFERWKELDGGAVVKEVYYAMKGGSPQIREDGGDAIVIFWVGGVPSV